MGNQSGKLVVKGSKFIDDVDLKNSRTNWIAGTRISSNFPWKIWVQKGRKAIRF